MVLPLFTVCGAPIHQLVERVIVFFIHSFGVFLSCRRLHGASEGLDEESTRFQLHRAMERGRLHRRATAKVCGRVIHDSMQAEP